MSEVLAESRRQWVMECGGYDAALSSCLSSPSETSPTAETAAAAPVSGAATVAAAAAAEPGHAVPPVSIEAQQMQSALKASEAAALAHDVSSFLRWLPRGSMS